jgi:hypothetical protein
MKMIEHAPCIVQYDNVFDPGNFIHLLEEECSQAWGYLHWERSTVGSGVVAPIRTSMSCELGPIGSEDISVERVLPLAQEWKRIWESIDPYVWDYRNTFELDLEADEGYRVLKYGGGASYHAHHDHWRDNSRTLSLVAFLNDGYSGGNLTFPKFDTSITPKAGSVILFPSNFPYIHIAEPVGSSDETIKYSLVTWFR